MSRPEPDWSFFLHGWRGQLGLAVALVVTAALTTWARDHFEQRAASGQQVLAALDQQRLDLATRLDARRQAEQRYIELRDAQVIGAEPRLEWAQALRDSATALGLPYLRYTAQPQQAFAATYLVDGEAPPVLASAVDIQAGLVHEGDLLRLIERLRDEAPGYFSVAACSLERVNRDELLAVDRPNIAGNCQLRWFSIPTQGTLVAEASP